MFTHQLIFIRNIVDGLKMTYPLWWILWPLPGQFCHHRWIQFCSFSLFHDQSRDRERELNEKPKENTPSTDNWLTHTICNAYQLSPVYDLNWIDWRRHISTAARERERSYKLNWLNVFNLITGRSYMAEGYLCSLRFVVRVPTNVVSSLVCPNPYHTNTNTSRMQSSAIKLGNWQQTCVTWRICHYDSYDVFAHTLFVIVFVFAIISSFLVFTENASVISRR